MKKISYTAYEPKPDQYQTYREWCFEEAITPEYRNWIQEASDDWLTNTYRLIWGRLTPDRGLTEEEQIELEAICHEMQLRDVKPIDA